MRFPTKYVPDSWRFVKLVTPEGETIIKVFAGWFGSGLTNGDSFKISSECVSFKWNEENKEYICDQYSGSVYHLKEGCEHTSTLMASAFVNVKEKFVNSGARSFDWIELDDVKKYFAEKNK